MITIGDILADVLKVVGDSNFRVSSKGWYTSQIQQALEELSFDTLFLTKSEIFDIPKNLRIKTPKGAFNIKQIYAFNGDHCNFENRHNVYHKRDFINSESGHTFVARNTGRNNHDPFYRNRMNQGVHHHDLRQNLLFYGVQNGVIMLSPSCSNFQKILIEFSGVSCDIGEVPFVPSFARQGVKDWVSVQALPLKMESVIDEPAQYRHYAGILSMKKQDLDDIYDGSWAKAKRRAGTLDDKFREDLKEYLTFMNY